MAASTKSENPVHLLRLPEVQQRVGLSRSSIYLRVASGEFPSPVNLGGRAVAWVDTEVQNWIAERITLSRTNGGEK